MIFRNALLAVPVALLAVPLYTFITLPPLDFDSCEEPVTVGKESITINACNVFSGSYQQARRRFVEACKGDLHSLPVVGQEYSMDICVIKRSSTKLVVHTSGVHGVEGYAGSAIQIAAMQNNYFLDGSSDSSMPTMVYVHAFNPQGMALFRRTNENNVDLNRNGIRQWPIDRASNEYKELDSVINPTWKPTIPNILLNVGQILVAIVQYGAASMKAATVQGQYFKPDGIFFGGMETQASYRMLEKWVQEFVADSQYQSVIWMDIHTGLGPKGIDTMQPGKEIGQAGSDFGKLVAEWWPISRNDYLSDKTETTQGYEEVIGLTGDYFSQVLPQALFIVQEFGTLPLVAGLPAMAWENAALQHGSRQDQAWWAHRTTRPFFYPNDPSWRAEVLKRGAVALQQCVAWVNAQDAN
jgi:Protein of unknown function (DUF2817)